MFISCCAVSDDDFVENKTAVEQLLYLSVATVLVRFKYYHAWVLADAICNLSGLGFNGYSADGTARWDLVSNVDVLGFEVIAFVNLHFCILFFSCVVSWLNYVFLLVVYFTFMINVTWVKYLLFEKRPWINKGI